MDIANLMHWSLRDLLGWLPAFNSFMKPIYVCERWLVCGVIICKTIWLYILYFISIVGVCKPSNSRVGTITKLIFFEVSRPFLVKMVAPWSWHNFCLTNWFILSVIHNSKTFCNLNQQIICNFLLRNNGKLLLWNQC